MERRGLLITFSDNSSSEEENCMAMESIIINAVNNRVI